MNKERSVVGAKDCRKEIGQKGEELASDFLQQKGWHLLARNWTTRMGELDIIAKEDNDLVFVEVRTTTGIKFGYGYESITVRKQQQIRRLALQYIQQHKLDKAAIRFDVVSVLLDRKMILKEINHLPGVF